MIIYYFAYKMKLLLLFICYFNLVFLSKCTDSSEVSGNVFFGYTEGTKTDAHKTQALNAITTWGNILKQHPTRQSIKINNGDVVGFMWVGSMVQNSGFADNILTILKNEVNTDGIPTELYIEYIGSDPMKSFGAILNTNNDLPRVQKAVKNWSSNQKYNTYKGSKNYGLRSICYLNYGDRKPEANDNEAGDCYTKNVQSGSTIQSQAGIPGEYLKAYNPNLNFNVLQTGQPYCYSEGSSNFMGNDVVKNLYFGYTFKNSKTDNNKKIALDMINKFKNDLNDVNRQSFKQNNAYMWVGNKINNQNVKNNILPILEKEVNNNGMPEEIYIQYVEDGNPGNTVGIVLNSAGDQDGIKNIVKNWSRGKSYNVGTGSKTYQVSISFSANKPERNDMDAGSCYTFTVVSGSPINSITKVPVGYLSAYNPNVDFFNVQGGTVLCESQGVNNAKPVSKCTTTDVSVKYGYWYKTGKIDTNKNKALNILNNFSSTFNKNSNKQGYQYNQDGIAAYMWVGQKVNNIDTLIKLFVNEVSANGIPEYGYMELINSDPMKTIGIVINTQNNLDMIHDIAKKWSSSTAYTTTTGSKNINSNICYLDDNNINLFTNDENVGTCITYNYVKNNLPFPIINLENYNPHLDFSSLSDDINICKSFGKQPKNFPVTCTTKYIAKDGDTCASIAKAHPPLTEQDIENLNKNNVNFFGCSNIWEEDELCI